MEHTLEYSILLGNRAADHLQRCPADVHRNLVATIFSLQSDPTPDGCSPIEEIADAYILLVNTRAIYYTVDRQGRVVKVYEIARS